MKLPRAVCLDFETYGIESRPSFPPRSVGFALKYPGKPSRYYAYEHPTENNCTRAQATAALKTAWAYAKACGVLCHNAKFDLDVAETEFFLPPLPWDKVQDSMFLAFLEDPHAPELGLKPLGERFLGLPPEEQDAVGEWLVTNQPVEGVKISRSKSSDHYFGRYIAYAPGKLVGAYACGDVDRTWGLFELLYPRIVERGMLEAYDRERKLLPVLLEMEQEGLPTDHKRLKSDVHKYQDVQAQLDQWLMKQLKVGADFNFNSGDQLVEALVAAGKCDINLMPKTPTGKVSTKKESLLDGVSDKRLLAALRYRTELKTSMGTFMESWLAMANQSGGKIFTTWNQVRGPSGGGNVGARTGRLSATWFMNMPKEFSQVFYRPELEKLIDDEDELRVFRALPKPVFPGLIDMPKVRGYITHSIDREEDNVLVDRDYSQQEPRILAHFDGGGLMTTYNENPWTDFHDFAKAELEKVGLFYKRKAVKNCNLGIIYGLGIDKLALRNKSSYDDAKVLKTAIMKLYPGLKAMYAEMKMRAATKTPVKTWGGRLYLCEPPKIIDGVIRTFDWKLVNVVIQGSGADCTKEAVLEWERTKRSEWRLRLTAHDELLATAPRKDLKAAMQCLKEAMESVKFDVPMLTEGAWSKENWAALKDYDKKGKTIYRG